MKTEREAKATMLRIGEDLIQKRKQLFANEKTEHSVGSDDDPLHGKDLLSVLVRSNMDPTIPESQRMCEEDILPRLSFSFYDASC